ncbi:MULTISPECIES: YidB family protein [Streptomyces]|uniref:YidB family protein n=1 Tax=Streptomyces TaxID=1883 RepID=UPI0015D4EBC6|nr:MULTISPECIES: YidB family protein [Streptomyces]
MRADPCPRVQRRTAGPLTTSGGTGENKPVSGDQISQALPDETLQQVAAQTGVSPREASDRIARSLPQVVDILTPSGELPPGASLEDLIRAQNL